MNKIKIIIYAITAYLGINIETTLILVSLMALDSFVGVIKVVMMNKKFTFRKLLLGFTAKLSFLIIPLVIALLGKSLGYNFHYVVNVTISILTVAEAYSIIGNIYAARNKVEIEKVDAISLLLLNVSKLIKKLLTNLLESINK